MSNWETDSIRTCCQSGADEHSSGEGHGVLCTAFATCHSGMLPVRTSSLLALLVVLTLEPFNATQSKADRGGYVLISG